MKILQIGFASLILFLLQACAAPAGEDQSKAVSGLEYTAQTGITDQERFREVLTFLEDGEPGAARVELMVYLQSHPDSEVGRDLLSQIDLPALDYFPEDFEEIRLQSGQSLSTLSKVYLGSLYRFHALAKYNGIAEPRSIKVGQVIRIPLTASAREVFAGDSSPASDSMNETAPKLAEDPAVEAAPLAEPTPAATTSSEEQLADRADSLHRQAVNAFRSQDLDKAILLWDQVLAIDPNYENARLQRSQAIELKDKLSHLN